MNPVAFAAVAFYGLAISFTVGWVIDPTDLYRRCAIGALVSGAVLTVVAYFTVATADQRRVTVEAMAFAGKATLLLIAVVMVASSAVIVATKGRGRR
jgi:hypothetical protein